MDVEGESGLLIVGKEVWDFGRLWMQRVSGSLIVGKEICGGGRLWMRRVSVGIIETERCI